MKRGRDDAVHFHRYGPAAAALRRGRVFRDAREAKKQIKVQDILRDAVEMHRFHSAAAAPRSYGEKGDSRLSESSPSSSSEALLLHSREELALYRQKKRVEMEAKVTRGRQALGNWVKYARWEAEQENFTRMRSVMERALVIHGLEANLWRDYAELEAANGFVQKAREVYSRAVKLLPASVDLWLKYVLLELAAGRETLAREVFMKWTQTESVKPPALAFELQILLEVAIHSPIYRSAEERRKMGLPDVGSNRGGEGSVSGSVSGGLTSSTHTQPSTALTTLPSLTAPMPSSSALSLYTEGLHFPIPSAGREPLAEVCRKILRHFVEVVNTPDSWLFYALVESVALSDSAREIKVLETAMQVLPSALLYGPKECRISLALAEARCRVGDIDGARREYHDLLDRVTDQKHTDLVLQRYRRFERLHAETIEMGEYVSFLQAKKKYERKLSKYFRRSGSRALLTIRGTVTKDDEEGEEEEEIMGNEKEDSRIERNISNRIDYDAALSLYVLLNQQQQRRIREQEKGKQPKGEEGGNLYAEDEQALEVLRQAVAVLPSPLHLVRCQQHAVLVSAFAKLAVLRYRCRDQKRKDVKNALAAQKADEVEVVTQEARVALAATIKQFPFQEASCTALWLDAAMLEEEVFRRDDLARRLLQSGFEVTKEMIVLEAWLDFELRAFQRAHAAAAQQKVKEEENGEKGSQEAEEGEKEEDRNSMFSIVTAEHLKRMQQVFQCGIKAAPLDASRWHLYAKWEEQQAFSSSPSALLSISEGSSLQAHRIRAATLYQHCISTLTAEARKLSLSLSERYALLQSVDGSWAKLMSLERRALRKSLRELQRSVGVSPLSPPLPLLEAVKQNADTLHRVSLSLLEDVAGGYHLEALAWALSYQAKSGTGVLSSLPPTSLPDSLNPAIVRFAEACDAVVQCLSREVAPAQSFYQHLISKTANLEDASEKSEPLSPTTITSIRAMEEQTGKRILRDMFQSLLAKERTELYRALMAGKEGSFEETKMAKTWREVLLGPILTEWGKYEAMLGGNLEAVGAAAASGLADGAISPSGTATVTRRRTRLFKKG